MRRRLFFIYRILKGIWDYIRNRLSFMGKKMVAQDTILLKDVPVGAKFTIVDFKTDAGKVFQHWGLIETLEDYNMDGMTTFYQIFHIGTVTDGVIELFDYEDCDHSWASSAAGELYHCVLLS